MSTIFNFANLRLPYSQTEEKGIFNFVIVNDKLKAQYYLLYFNGRRYMTDTFITAIPVPMPQGWYRYQDCEFTDYLAGMEQAIRRQMARTNEPILERRENIIRIINYFKLPVNAKTKQVGGNIV